MQRPANKIAAVAATVVTTAALSVILASAPAGAATPQTKGCSGWAQAGATKYYVRECAGTVRYKAGMFVKETAYIKNASSHVVPVTGFVSVSWGQAGDGASFAVHVNPGHTGAITHAFKITAHGTYTATSSITVAKHSASAKTKFVY